LLKPDKSKAVMVIWNFGTISPDGK
jgi:hypothetical protein